MLIKVVSHGKYPPTRTSCCSESTSPSGLCAPPLLALRDRAVPGGTRVAVLPLPHASPLPFPLQLGPNGPNGLPRWAESLRYVQPTLSSRLSVPSSVNVFDAADIEGEREEVEADYRHRRGAAQEDC